MKILVVSYDDDNFGDNLIKICFVSLLKIVLKNLGLKDNQYTIKKMPLKKINSQLIISADIIAFAGGGLFGLSYLGFYEYLDQITDLAAQNNIPVIFSSIGINNMDAVEQVEEPLKNLLYRKCISAVSVRENIGLFRRYTEECSYTPEQVCDPAVWTKYVYNLKKDPEEKRIGINVVRGGLFRDNGKNWGMKNELDFLNSLRRRLEEAGLDYRFYTNGSVFDNNTLHYFEREYNIPSEKCIYPHTTRELVETVSSFREVVTFRMHSSIIAYSYGIPSVALVWNDKIPFFYENIGHSDRIFLFGSWDGRQVYEKVKSILDDRSAYPDVCSEKYMMSLYNFLYHTFGKYTNMTAVADPAYDFNTVTELLADASDEIDEESYDLHLKLEKAEKHYLARFTEIKRKDKELDAQKKQLIEYRGEIEQLIAEKISFQKKISAEEKRNRENEKELQMINGWLSVRFEKKIRAAYRRLIPKRIREKLRHMMNRKK